MIEAFIGALNDYAPLLSAAGTVAIAFYARASLRITRQLAEDNRALLKANTEPEMFVYMEIDRRTGYLVNLVFENIGSGPAIDVSFEIDAHPADFRVHNVHAVEARSNRKLQSAIPQGGKSKIFFANIDDLMGRGDDAPLEPFDINVRYSNLRNKEMETGPISQDVAGFEGALAGRSAEQQMTLELNRLNSSVKSFRFEVTRLRSAVVNGFEKLAGKPTPPDE